MEEFNAHYTSALLIRASGGVESDVREGMTFVQFCVRGRWTQPRKASSGACGVDIRCKGVTREGRVSSDVFRTNDLMDLTSEPISVDLCSTHG